MGATTIQRRWRFGEGRSLSLDQPRLMGVLNVTPDSFSDGGLHLAPDVAIGRALRMIEEGAAVIDIGGESTRPRARSIEPDEQIARTVPVIERLRAMSDVVISIDTTRFEVAKAALNAGADIINDVAAGTEDDRLFALIAEYGCGLVLMHRLLPPDRDSYSHRYAREPEYGDVVAEVRAFLIERAQSAIDAGIDPASIVIDPGLGFGKSVEQNFELIRRFDELAAGAYPVLCGASRKSFIGAAAGVEEPSQRIAGSISVAVAAFFRGVRLFRVHDVAAHREALAVAAKMLQ